MKKIIAIILFSVVCAFAQVEKPLTQPEYVKLLYAANTAAKRQDLIETLRKRGISFVLTDGLRGLTKTKGANDNELNKTLEEANRRRENPSDAKLPDEKEAKEIIEKTRQNTLAAVDEMPDFVAKQLLNRGIGYAGTNRFQSLDKFIIAVSYSSEKGEQYQVLSANGEKINAQKGSNYFGLGGATTGGEFVKDLKTLFENESKTDFTFLDRNTVRNHSTYLFEYKIDIENNKQGGVLFEYSKYAYEVVPSGQKGKIWIDTETLKVLRIEYELTDLKKDFPIKAFKKIIDYDLIKIADEKYLLPISSDSRMTIRDESELLQTQNIIRFKEYQKYGTEIKILDDDVVDEEKPKQP